VYANRRRLKTESGIARMRRRGTPIQRTFTHRYDTGSLHRVHLRGPDTIAQRLLIHAAAFHLNLILRQRLGVGTADGGPASRALFFGSCAPCRLQIRIRCWLPLGLSPPTGPTRCSATI